MRKILILPVLLMALCFPSFADGNVITLDEAISSAMENNTDMEIARLELQQSIRSANNASQYIPDLSLSGMVRFNGSIINQSWSGSANFSAGISMGLGTSMIGTTAANNAAKILANLNYAMSLSSVEQSVTTSYWNLVSAKRGMESAKTSLEAARRTYESVQDAYSAGLATSLDLSNAELEVLNYESALKQLEDAYALSQEAFRILTGIEGGFDVTDFPQIAYLDLPTAEELYASYGDNTNTVRMLNATVASSEAALTVQKVSNLYPSVSLSLNYNVDGDYNYVPDVSNDFKMNDTASATVSFSIPVGSYIPGSKGNTAVRNAEDDVAISKINLVAGRENLLSTIRSTLIKIEQSRSNIEIYTKMVDLAQRTYDLAEESYNAGLSSLSDLQKKMDSLSSAQMDLINAESEYIQNVYTLAFTLNLDYESLVTLYAEK